MEVIYVNGVDFILIKKTRKEKKLTLKEMADALGLTSASAYYKYENGIYKFKAEHLPLLVSMLKLRLEDIFLVA